MEPNNQAYLSTVPGQIVTAVPAIWYLFHTRTVKLSKEDFRFHVRIIRKTLVPGICSFLSRISLVAASTCRPKRKVFRVPRTFFQKGSWRGGSRAAPCSGAEPQYNKNII